MKEAGYESGFSVTMMAPNNRYIEDARIAERRRHARQDQHQGRSANHAQGAILAALRRARRRHHDDRLAVDTQDSANFYEFLVMTPDQATGYGQYNAGNYSNKEVDKLTLQTQSMLDVKRAARF
jgi:peptide/nickel transport system substrate-binding protein